MGIRANRQSIPNVSTNPWSRERCSLSASNGCIYSPTGLLRRSCRAVGNDTSESFRTIRANVGMPFVVLILEFQQPSRSFSIKNGAVISTTRRLGRRSESSATDLWRIQLFLAALVSSVMEGFVIGLFRHLNQRSVYVKCC